MSKNKNTKMFSSFEDEIAKIDKKTNNIFFYVIDTEGYASGSLAYIYQLAKFLYDDGYNVKMLYMSEGKGKDREKFVGVGDWLGKEYAELPHLDVFKDEVPINVSDILFIPDVYCQVMNQTQKLKCKRIAIVQNYDFIISQMPTSADWGKYKIFDAICNTKAVEKRLKGIFPYVNTTVIDPFIEKRFGVTKGPKKMSINVICRNKDDAQRLVRPFYWKYPYFKWVTFEDLRGMSKDNFARALREGCITVWIDEFASFGYSALEAMASGNVVFAKRPLEPKDWALDKDGKLNDSCIWFDNIDDIHDLLANMIRRFITDSIPQKIFDNQKVVEGLYSEEKTKKEIIDYVGAVLAERKKGIQEVMTLAKNKEEKEENND